MAPNRQLLLLLIYLENSWTWIFLSYEGKQICFKKKSVIFEHHKWERERWKDLLAPGTLLTCCVDKTPPPHAATRGLRHVLIKYCCEAVPDPTTMKSKTRIVQISNIAPQATKDQMSTLFGFIGKIEDIRLYPTMLVPSVWPLGPYSLLCPTLHADTGWLVSMQ